ncbi:hypothetical protein [Methylobacterium sp. ID0610]|uniref:hypothetical protein n=1 Tax=Methylobacterium carpenticola TaxID=3344827 RepID=UPI0036B971B2
MTRWHAGLAALGLIAGLTVPALAHDHPAANGGQIKQIGPYEAELVVKGAEMTLHIVDERDRKVDAGAFTATATVLARGNEQKLVELKPSGENRLSGRIDFPVDGKVRATVSLRTPAGEAGKGRYSLDATR